MNRYKGHSNESVREVDASKVATVNPSDTYVEQGPGGSTITHSGGYVTGDLDAAVNRASTDMPKPLPKSK